MGVPPEQNNHKNLIPGRVTLRKTRTGHLAAGGESESKTKHLPASQVTPPHTHPRELRVESQRAAKPRAG